MCDLQGKCYEFDGLLFDSDARTLVRLRDKHTYALTPKENLLLAALVARQNTLVTYDELRREVWAGSPRVLAQTIHETKRTLAKHLGVVADKLETVMGRGYRFAVEAVECQAARSDVGQIVAADKNTPRTELFEAPTPPTIALTTDVAIAESETAHTPGSITAPMTRRFGGHTRHALACSALYTVALLTEIAYEFDRYGRSALTLAPLVFVWIFSTSLTVLSLATRSSRRDGHAGLLTPLLVFVFAALLLHFALGFFLPATSVTQARFRTYTAHGAYLKSVVNFLPLAAIFIVLPFHFAAAARNAIRDARQFTVTCLLQGADSTPPAGAIYLPLRWLAALFFVAGLAAFLLTSYLFENLRPAAGMNLFMHLALWRLLLYFALGLECVLWYRHALDALKRFENVR
jgi:DNA-binding winged helix-turn-helix (wHTH) protein